MLENNSKNTNRIIFLNGGPSAGKSTTRDHLLKMEELSGFKSLDSDKAITGIMERDNIGAVQALDVLLDSLPAILAQGSFIMDYWLPPQMESRLREMFSEDTILTIWLHCPSGSELKKREEERESKGEARASDMVNCSLTAKPKFKYDYTLDTSKKAPVIVAELVCENAIRPWSKD